MVNWICPQFIQLSGFLFLFLKIPVGFNYWGKLTWRVRAEEIDLAVMAGAWGKVGFGDGHFYHVMRWRCFIFYNDAISIIFGHSLPSPSLRLFSQIIGIDYFAMFE